MRAYFPEVPCLLESPHYAPVAVVPAGSQWIIVGGQNAVNEQGEVVGSDISTQARQVSRNIEAALAAAGCDWSHVVRVTVSGSAARPPARA